MTAVTVETPLLVTSRRATRTTPCATHSMRSTMNYGRAIRIARTARGLSQKELADELGVVPSYVSLLESGGRSPSTRTLESLAHALSIPMHLLMLIAAGKSELRGLTGAQAQSIASELLELVLDDDPEGK